MAVTPIMAGMVITATRISPVIPTPAGNHKFPGRINPPVTLAGGFFMRAPAVNTLVRGLD
jgi:hypothetical protein